MTQIDYRHVFRVARRSTVDGAPVEVSDGAMVIGRPDEIPSAATGLPFSGFDSAVVHDHRPGFNLPGFVDTRFRFPRAPAGDSHGGGNLLERLDRCNFASGSQFANPEFAACAATSCATVGSPVVRP